MRFIVFLLLPAAVKLIASMVASIVTPLLNASNVASRSFIKIMAAA